MIKDVFKLNPNSWHAKLMNYIWGWEAKTFRNMCPYFWLSVLNVLISPIVFLIKIIIVPPFAFLAKKTDEYTEYCVDQLDKFVTSKSDSIADKLKTQNELDWDDPIMKEILTYATHDKSWNELSEKAQKVYLDLEHYENKRGIEVKVRSLAISKLFWRKLEEKKELVEIARSAKKKATKNAHAEKMKAINKRAKQGKYIGIPIVGLGGLVLLWYIGLGTYYLILEMITWPWLLILGITLFLSGSIGLFWLLCLLVKKVTCNLQVCQPCDERKERCRLRRQRLGAAIALPFKLLWNAVTSSYYFIKTMQGDNCPGIDWED